MTGIDIVEKLAEMQRLYDDAHKRVRPIEHYRERHARRHPHQGHGELHVVHYQKAAS